MTHETEASEQPEDNGGTNTVATQCLSIVDQYCGGIVTKGDAIYEFAKAIPVGETEAEESPGKTLESYVAMLDDWNRERTLSDVDEQREGAQNEPRTDINKQPRKQGERCEEDEYDDECTEPVHRQPKIDLGQFPWSVLRQGTSALAGDPDPYPRVCNFCKWLLRSAQVTSHRQLGAVSQVPVHM